MSSPSDQKTPCLWSLHILDLPNEVIATLFDFLGLDVLVTLSVTCGRLRHLVSHYILHCAIFCVFIYTRYKSLAGRHTCE